MGDSVVAFRIVPNGNNSARHVWALGVGSAAVLAGPVEWETPSLRSRLFLMGTIRSVVGRRLERWRSCRRGLSIRSCRCQV